MSATPFTLPALPYEQNALAPHLSSETLDYHYGKHHNAYVNNLNNLVAGKPLADMSLEQIVKETVGKADAKGVFNNAAQVWNHTFYWKSMRPGGGGKPGGKVLEGLEAAFGSFEAFSEQFGKAAVGQFGSGWAWLVEDGGKLAIETTANADTPMAHGRKCLLTVDVWEHAYYVDFRNRRPDYVNAVLGHLINWEFAAQNLG